VGHKFICWFWLGFYVWLLICNFLGQIIDDEIRKVRDFSPPFLPPLSSPLIFLSLPHLLFLFLDHNAKGSTDLQHMTICLNSNKGGRRCKKLSRLLFITHPSIRLSIKWHVHNAMYGLSIKWHVRQYKGLLVFRAKVWLLYLAEIYDS